MMKRTAIKDQLPKEIYATFYELKVAKFIRLANISKQKGFSSTFIFVYLFSIIFKGKNLFQLLVGRTSSENMKKDTVYRFMNNPKNNWRKFLGLLSAYVIAKVHLLTSSQHPRVLIIDDSSFYRNRSTKVANLAYQFDHALQRSYKGFRMLTLAFSDGHTFLPVDFSLLSSKNTIESDPTDRRTAGGIRAKEAQGKSTELTAKMVDRALRTGIYPSHILMDKWFVKPALIRQLFDLGIHTVGMVANTKTKYLVDGKLVTLTALYKMAKKTNHTAILSETTARLKDGLPINVIFVKNKNKKSEWLAILTTDTSMSAEEIVKTYRIRWDIETFFKVTKSILNLEKGTQTRNYNALICHTTIVFVRYILLSWQHRCANDDRTLGTIFYETCDEMADLDWAQALTMLVQYLVTAIEKISNKMKTLFTCLLQNWYASLPSYIKAYLPILVCES